MNLFNNFGLYLKLLYAYVCYSPSTIFLLISTFDFLYSLTQLGSKVLNLSHQSDKSVVTSSYEFSCTHYKRTGPAQYW